MIPFGLAAQSPDNLIQNSGFEVPVTTGWALDLSTLAKGNMVRAESAAHSGKYGLVLAPNALNHDDFGIGQPIDVVPLRGKFVYFSGWIRVKGDATAVIQLIAKAPTRASYRQLRQEATDGYVFRRDVVFVPPDANYLALICFVSGTSGVAGFDDVMVSLQEANNWTTGQYDPGPPLQASATIHAESIVRQIPSTLFGMNLEWLYNGQDTWDEKNQRLDPTVMQLASESNSKLWRYPGGLFANYYNWRNGIGPQQDRPVVVSAPFGPLSANGFGTDEYMAFMEKLNGQGLITVNAHTSTADEAAAWVQYVNNGERRVEYWEIGNELYLDYAFDPTAPVWTPESYVETFLKFAAAMRAADPHIKLGADLDFNSYVSVGHLHPTWTDVVLRGTASEMDFVSVHNAFAPVIDYDDGLDVRTIYASMLGAPVSIRNALRTLSAKIDALGGARAPQIRIGVTEWGPFFQTSPQSRLVDHVKTLASGLYVASVMKVLLEEPRVELAGGFKLLDRSAQGWIGDRNQRYIPKAPYYAYQMFTQHFGPLLVASEVSTPTFDTRSVGWVDGVPNAPYLEVVSSTDEARNTLYVIVINKHFDRDIETSINLTGFQASGEGTVWSLTGTGVDANTGTSLPESWSRQTEAIPDARFYQGAPGEVQVTSSALPVSGNCFTYTFPARSVTALVLRGAAQTEGSPPVGCDTGSSARRPVQ